MAQHRHQSYLESVLDFSPSFFLTPLQNQKATALLDKLIWYYGLEQTVHKGYKPAILIQETYHRVASRDTFLKFFFSYIYEIFNDTNEPDVDIDISVALSYVDNFIGDPSQDSSKIINVKEAVEKFAEYIVDNFFLPLRASSAKTPQATPKSLSSMQTPAPTGTRQRVSILRQSCLVRDRHRCMVSHKFDIAEARKRAEQHGDDTEDDDGNPLRNEARGGFQYLEVAHILPHSLRTVTPGETDLSESKKYVFRILDMFEPGISHRLDASKIDSPMNALTLTHDYHRLFGEFLICFERTGPHQYRIDSLEQNSFLRDPLFPVTQTLSLSSSRTIDPPDYRLLGVHCAIAHIMKLSGAGEYIEKILRDMEEVDVNSDGSTNLGYITGLRLDGWLNTLAVF